MHACHQMRTAAPVAGVSCSHAKPWPSAKRRYLVTAGCMSTLPSGRRTSSGSLRIAHKARWVLKCQRKAGSRGARDRQQQFSGRDLQRSLLGIYMDMPPFCTAS